MDGGPLIWHTCTLHTLFPLSAEAHHDLETETLHQCPIGAGAAVGDHRGGGGSLRDQPYGRAGNHAYDVLQRQCEGQLGN